MFGQLIATLKKSPKTIVFTEGTDPRILEASARLLSGNFLKPVLVGNPEEIPRTIPRWTRWSSRWSSCARAR